MNLREQTMYRLLLDHAARDDQAQRGPPAEWVRLPLVNARQRRHLSTALAGVFRRILRSTLFSQWNAQT